MILALDLDGTLITAEERQSFLLKAVADRYCISLSCESIWEKKRAGKNNFDLLLELNINRSLAFAISTEWIQEVETSYWLSLDTLFNDTHETLHRLAEKNIGAVLITARNNEYLMRQQVFRLGLSKLLEHTYCVSPSKAVTEKQAILRLVKAVGFVGDSETDLHAARLAGVEFCGVSTGQRSKEFLLHSGVPYVGDCLADSVNYLLESAKIGNNCNDLDA